MLVRTCVHPALCLQGSSVLMRQGCRSDSSFLRFFLGRAGNTGWSSSRLEDYGFSVDASGWLNLEPLKP